MVDGSVNVQTVVVDAVGEVKGMSSWYLYYRLLHVLRQHYGEGAARLSVQDVLVDLRNKTVIEWPGATEQEVQDFFEHMAGNPYLFDERQMKHLTKIEG